MNSLQTLLSKFDKRWLGAGAAAAGAMAATQASEAAIVWSGVVNINIPATTAGVYVNVVANTTGFTSALAGWDINPWGGGTTTLNFFSSTTSGQTVATNMRTLAGSTTTYARLAPGASIAPGDPFSTNVGTQTVNAGAPMLLNSSDNCVGFRFQNESTGQVHYGTARISVGANLGTRSIVEYAWENTPGVGIVACAPEPSSLALLALGAVGLIRRRK